VAVGDVVNKGDRIGTVGEGALFESADDPHLHFAVHKDGKPVDPHDMWNW
jgi:murein DD-endopeptidase MepM/ murein hydrolase activator NlpD